MRIEAFYRSDFVTKTKFPIFTCTIPAGGADFFDDYIETELGLADFTRKTETTWFVKVSGDSMIGAGIRHGDLLIVDASVEPVNGDIVVVSLDNHLTVKRLKLKSNEMPLLIPENPDYVPVLITKDMNFKILGVVMSGIHKYRKF